MLLTCGGGSIRPTECSTRPTGESPHSSPFLLKDKQEKHVSTPMEFTCRFLEAPEIGFLGRTSSFLLTLPPGKPGNKDCHCTGHHIVGSCCNKGLHLFPEGLRGETRPLPRAFSRAPSGGRHRDSKAVCLQSCVTEKLPGTRPAPWRAGPDDISFSHSGGPSVKSSGSRPPLLLSPVISPVDFPLGGLNIVYPLLSLPPQPEADRLPRDSGYSPLIPSCLGSPLGPVPRAPLTFP